MNRFDRNIRFFGEEGQDRLRATTAAVIGVGGLGTHVVQQFTHLGLRRLVLIDDEFQEETNKNRNVGSYATDPDSKILKVDVAERLAKLIDPSVEIEKIPESLFSETALVRLQTVDYVFGCIDNEGARLVLTEHCLAFKRPYFDLASDIQREDGLRYGGRVCVAMNGAGCLVCMQELDREAAREDLENPEARKDREAIYGVTRDELGVAGPSVVSINGVVASLGVTEFMLMVTGVRLPNRLLTYRGQLGKVLTNTAAPDPHCYYCRDVFGLGELADTLRYARLKVR